MISLFLVAQLVTARPAVDCSLLTVQQAQGLVCLPAAPAPLPPAPVPPPASQGPLVPGFQVGRAYERDATGARIFIVSLGVARNGQAVFATECLTESTQDQCFFPGEGRFIVANANTLGWTLLP